jgi:hypothetical protein
MSATCPECDMEFSRKDAMLRHKRNRHGTTQPYPQSSQAYPPPPPPPQQVVLQHPFTLMAIDSPFDDKRYILDDGINSLDYGHLRI